MARTWMRCLAGWLFLGLGFQHGWAETVDATRQVSASGSVGSVASLTVSTLNISDNSSAGGLSFGSVAVGQTTPWVRAPQYFRVQHQSNHPSWAIRIITNNRSTFPTMVGRVTDGGNLEDPNDDKLGYSGLVGDPTDPNARVPLGWQVYKDPVSGGPAVPLDAQVGGNFDSPWVFLADASDCTSQCRSATPVTIDKTHEFFRIAQGDSTNGFLLLHPNQSPRTADGEIAVYVAGRFGGAPAGSYSSNVIIELHHF